MKKIPSIFNDVIGPVMRGPSSSHTAASWRIARISLDILNDVLEAALIEFDSNGAWAPNFREQGTCMGIDGGLLGLDITDEGIKNTEKIANKKGIKIEYKISSFPTRHANTVRLTLRGEKGKTKQIVAISTGGGAFEIQSIDGFSVSFFGDLFGLVFYTKHKNDIQKNLDESTFDVKDYTIHEKNGVCCFECKSSVPFLASFIAELEQYPSIESFAVIHPVLPVLSGNQTELPFDTIQSLIEYSEKMDADLGDLGLLYERCRSGFSHSELNGIMSHTISIINKSIDTGLEGTVYQDRILPQQSHLIRKAETEGKIKDTVFNSIIANVSALMESKSGMEVIVAVPTAGSCGAVGGALRAMADTHKSTNDELIKAYFAAGLVGAYFAMGPGFSAEEHGCQVECGAASGMAAAGLVQLMGGTAKQALGAAAMAIQNMIGLVCDPVADRVEVPCLGKNISAAVNAYSSAIMAVSGFDPVIPLDQVIQTVARVSKSMPTCVKCTGKGGLAITESAIQLKKKLSEYKA